MYKDKITNSVTTKGTDREVGLTLEIGLHERNTTWIRSFD